MSNPKYLSLASILVLALAGCTMGSPFSVAGSGVSGTEPREVEQFDRVNLRGSGTVNVTIGQERSVRITADDNILPLIETLVSGGELVIEPKGSISPKTRIWVDIVVPSLKAAAITGSGDIVVTGLDEPEVAFTVSGSGDVRAAGSAGKVRSEIRGSGDILLRDLKARSVAVSVSGSGSAEVNASDDLTASIAGSGNVRYVGQPKNVQQSISGSGSVRPAS